MNLKRLCQLLVVVATLALSSCVYYPPVPVAVPGPSRFDQSWAAASGAIVDNGLTITQQDRATGMIRGERGDNAVTATLEPLPDGRVQVKFNARGDPGLLERVSNSYERRMGR